MRTDQLHPVLLGSDLGIYSLVRAFHEAYAVRSTVVCEGPRGPVDHSRIVDAVYTGADPDDETRLAALEGVARADRADRTRILVANNDGAVAFIQRHADRLARHFTLTVPPAGPSEMVSSKSSLEAMAAEAGILTPQTHAVPLADLSEAQASARGLVGTMLTAPVVVKVATSATYEHLSFPGKKKAYTAADADEVVQIMARIHAAGYRDDLILQEFIPGDDTQGRLVTAYIGQDGGARMAVTGHLLLGLHSPAMIGNSAVVLTRPIPELADASVRMLRSVGYRGFANLDFRVDPRDGKPRLLDVNPRIGRPNYYVALAGINPAQVVVEDLFGEDAPPSRLGPVPDRQDDASALYAYVPWLFARRYVTDKALRDAGDSAWRNRRSAHPLTYKGDVTPGRLRYRALADANLVRQFLKHYPRPLTDGF